MRALSQGARGPGGASSARGTSADRGDGRGGSAARPASLSDRRGGFTGAIIGGGNASRFAGRPKGLEIVGGARIIDRVAGVLRETCDRLVIAPGTMDAAGWLRDATIAPDLLPVRASITGVHAAIVGGGEKVVAVAWDMPFVPTRLIRELQSRLRGKAQAVIPVVDGRPEPLCAAYARGAADRIGALVAGGSLKVSDILGRLDGVVTIEDAELREIGDPAVMFFNVNTPADLERAEAIATSL